MKIKRMTMVSDSEALVETTNGTLHKATNVEHVGISNEHKSVYKATVHLNAHKTTMPSVNPKLARENRGIVLA